MDYEVFIKELEALRGCQFMYLHESRKIEDLVQSYLESSTLHSLDHTIQLLYQLLNSEYAPLQRVARTGLQPSGFWVRKFPRVGPWVVYTGFIAIWAVSIMYAVSPYRSSQTWALFIPLLGFTIYHLHGWFRIRALAAAVRELIDREILPGRFDPATLSDRLHALEHKGLKVHPNVFTLLQLQQRLHGPSAGFH